jgi:aldose sugar dehydrogenase
MMHAFRYLPRGPRTGGTPAAGSVLFALALTASVCTRAATQTPATFVSEKHSFRVVTVAEGLDHPWGLAFLPNGDMLVTERPGRLRSIRNGTLEPEPIAGVPEVWARGQGGLLDVALHPAFATNRLVYLSFARPSAAGAGTAVVRGRLEGGNLTDVREIFVSNTVSGGGNHFGSRLAFDRQGLLYVTAGDRGHSPNAADHNAQNLGKHAGSVLRLHDDGRVPADNPFAQRSDAQPEIFSYGHRNPQALAFHPETGQLWATEHGARGGDELNLIQAGRNYGWPIITHGINYNRQPIGIGKERAGLEQPIVYWVPSIATSGMAFYTGDRFPGWKGDLFVGGLAGMQLERITLRGTQVLHRETLLGDYRRRIRDVRNGPDGYIYLLIDDSNGQVVRLEPVR